MHELGIVFHIAKQVEEVAVEHHISRVTRVTLEIGEVSTVVPEYLEDCWKWNASKSDILRDCRLEVEMIPAVTFCEDCQQTYPTVEHGKTCPYCGSEHTYLVQGNEQYIKEIEVYEPDEDEAAGGSEPHPSPEAQGMDMVEP